MSDVVIVAIISGLCTLVGTFAGIMTSSKQMLYRIEQLEKKQDKHNSTIERTYKLEQHCAIQDEEIKALKETTNEIKRKVESL